ncbi:hypothetical protein C3Y87_18295 [Carbonactinospora thermoautotrophica]|uniref:SpoIIE family protein phosphatase n=1 Tax=Carbonactinospora thermoautotrophica TaxID=1469144 RepID=UPI00226F0394|nr:SpoIIE family protein phosphatase [Carbonactinospora thermoautotrophica]MCX9193317.1 hypothetical protein [Carbonactinospora thermoautotrophica]
MAHPDEAVLRDPARLAALRRVNAPGTRPNEAFDRLARLAAKLLHAPIALVNFIDEEHQCFQGCFGLEEPWASTRRMPADWGFCPITLSSGKPVLFNDVRVLPQFRDDPAIDNLGIVAYAGIPLIDQDGRALGTLCVIDSRPRYWTEADLQTLHDLATTIFSEITLREYAEEQARLLEAFEHAPSLVAILRGRERVITMANAAFVRVFGPFQQGTPARQAWPALSDEEFRGCVDQAYRSGEPVRIPEKTVLWKGPDGTVQGCFTFVFSPLRAASGDVDGVLIVGVDVTEQTRAREELRETALTLQQSLLPGRLYQPDSLEIAGRYLPGSPDAAVSGDWLDVVPLGADRTALVIGDVMGQGVHAAAVMGQLRSAVRAYARLDLPPSEVLGLLDGVVQEVADDQIVTCVYAIYDPADGVLCYASAGHLPPLLVNPDHTVHRLELAHGAPLGVKAGLFHSGRVELRPGTTVALYTDGLVEERGQDIDIGVEVLMKILGNHRGDLQQTCDRILKELPLANQQPDDIALLLFRVSDTWRQRQAVLPLSTEMVSVRDARRFAESCLRTWQVPEPLAREVVVVVSELVSNALQHGIIPGELRLREACGQLYVEVRDANPTIPHLRPAEPLEEKGRGLRLVEALSQRWGARRTETGKSVWCQFPLPRVL